MDNIIAGRFQTDDEARAAGASLSDLVDKNDICIFSTISRALMTRLAIRKAQVMRALQKARPQGQLQEVL